MSKVETSRFNDKYFIKGRNVAGRTVIDATEMRKLPTDRKDISQGRNCK